MVDSMGMALKRLCLNARTVLGRAGCGLGRGASLRPGGLKSPLQVWCVSLLPTFR